MCQEKVFGCFHYIISITLPSYWVPNPYNKTKRPKLYIKKKILCQKSTCRTFSPIQKTTTKNNILVGRMSTLFSDWHVTQKKKAIYFHPFVRGRNPCNELLQFLPATSVLSYSMNNCPWWFMDCKSFFVTVETYNFFGGSFNIMLQHRNDLQY